MEILIATAIGGLVMYLALSQFKWLSGKQSKETAEQTIRVQLDVALNHISRLLYNAASLKPSEDLLAKADIAYRGVAAIDGGAVPIPNCQYKKEGSKEIYSILKVSAINSLLGPEKTHLRWNEKDLTTTELKLTLHKGTNHLFSNGKQNSKEMLLIDADALSIRRYKVKDKSVTIIKDLDPATGQELKGFEYTSVFLEMPLTPFSQMNSSQDLWFITSSMAYGLNTNRICVNTAGDLVSVDEQTNESHPWLSPHNQYKIESFSVQFFNSKVGDSRLDRSLFYLFPYGSAEIDTTRRTCLNVALVQITVSFKSGSEERKTLSLDRTFVLNNLSQKRPVLCK